MILSIQHRSILRVSVLLLFVLFITEISRAQIYDGAQRGVHFGSTLGNTNLSDDRPSWLVKPFIRHGVTTFLDGELSIGIGMLNSTEYRTMMIPADYTLSLHPFRGYSLRRGRLPKVDLFGYAGLGVLNYHHNRILRPDDPFTVDAGNTIPNADHWTFDKYWIAQAPVGLGAKIKVDRSSSLVLRFGYTFTNSTTLVASQLGSKEGFWSASVGMSLGRNRVIPERYRPIESYSVPIVEAVVVEEQEPVIGVIVEPDPVVEIAPIVESEPPAEIPPVINEVEELPVVAPAPLLPSMANFGLLSAELDDIAYDQLVHIANYLNYHKDRGITLTGHTDNTGTIGLNEILGYQRAWNMKERLMAAGIEFERIAIVSRGYRQPMADNSTANGRRLNRRVEFESDSKDTVVREGVRWIDQLNRNIVPTSTNAPAVGMLVEFSPFVYSPTQVYPTDEHVATLAGLYEMMSNNPEMTFRIVGISDRVPNQGVNNVIAEARASRVKEYMLYRGISKDRIEAITEYQWDGQHHVSQGRILIIRTK